jgi:PD-(D/E)XK nuclease superfamily protein
MSDLRFITPPSSSHWYSKSGKPRYDAGLREARKELLYTSVSTICGEMRNYGLELYKMNQVLHSCLTLPRYPGESDTEFAKRVNLDSKIHAEKASRWGTGCHEALEAHEKAEPIEETYRPYIPHYIDFRDKYIERAIESELILVDHDVPAAGRCDLIYENPFNEVCMLDYKSTTVKEGDKPEWRKSWLLQLAAYREAYRKTHSLPIGPRCFSVVINSLQPGPFFVKEWTTDQLDDAYQAFRHVANYWHWSRDYFPNGKPPKLFL